MGNKKVLMHTDGSCAPVHKNGFASCGVYIKIYGTVSTSEEVYTGGKYIGCGNGFTSYRAEYAGLELGLETLISLGLENRRIKAGVDLLLIIEHIQGIKTPEKKHSYYKHYKNVVAYLKQFPNLDIFQIRSEDNLADSVARKALDPFRDTQKWERMKQGDRYNGKS